MKKEEIFMTEMEAEVGILGGLLLEEKYPIYKLNLFPEDFKVELHKKIFTAIINVHNSMSGKVCPQLINKELREMGEGDQSSYLLEIVEHCSSAAFLDTFAKQLKLYRRAENIKKNAELLASLMNTTNPDFSSVANIVEQINNIASVVKPTLEESVDIPSVLEFPLDIYPTWLQNFCSSVQKSIGVPVDFPAISALSCAATLIGKKVEIQIKRDWKESSRFYIAIVADPSSGKTPAMTTCFSPIYKLEEQFRKENSFNDVAFQESMEKYEIEKEDWKKNFKKGTKIPPPPKPEEPKKNRMYTTDYTVEALSTLLSDENSLLIFQDELTSWVNGLNAYKTGKGKDKDFFLSNWSGTPIIVDRKRDKTQYIKNPFLGVIGGLTPENLSLIKGETRDGWASRILFSCPTKIKRFFSEYSVPENEIQKYEEKMTNLFYDKPKTLVLSYDARQLFSQYDTQLKNEIYEEGNPWIADALGKLSGYLARFILVLHCLENVDSACIDLPVTTDCVEKAIRLTEYFKQNMKKIYVETDMEEEDKKLLGVINYLQRKGKKEYSVRDLYVGRIPGCKNAKESKQKISLLIEKGYARWIIKEKTFEFFQKFNK